jgi:hypothetical protein
MFGDQHWLAVLYRIHNKPTLEQEFLRNVSDDRFTLKVLITLVRRQAAITNNVHRGT